QWAYFWTTWTSAAFMRGYLDAAAGGGMPSRPTGGGTQSRPGEGAPLIPADPASAALLLDAWMLRKVMYELTYELNSRPAWTPIPLRGALNLLDRFQRDREDS